MYIQLQIYTFLDYPNFTHQTESLKDHVGSVMDVVNLDIR